MAVLRIQHELYAQSCMDYVLFTNVGNMKDVRKSVMSGELEATLLKTQLVRRYLSQVCSNLMKT